MADRRPTLEDVAARANVGRGTVSRVVNGSAQVSRPARGRQERVAFGDFSELSGMLAMRRLLDADAGVDAVFAASDNMAVGALRELERRGRRVPDDVAVVGFEDAGLVLAAQPALTTVHQPTEVMGRRMMAMLLERIGGPVPRSEIVCATDLVLRQSA